MLHSFCAKKQNTRYSRMIVALAVIMLGSIYGLFWGFLFSSSVKRLQLLLFFVFLKA